jgi:hypothetical protein
MLNVPAGPGRSKSGSRPGIVAAAAVALALMLAGCSSGSSGSQGSTGAASSTAGTGTSSSASTSSSAGTSATSSMSQNASSTATVGALVPGFPSTLIPLMPGAMVQSSSLDKSKPLVTASLVASSSAKSDDVLAFYTKALQDQGFTALPGDTVGSVPSKDFTRADGKETVNISVVPSGSSVTFTIGANVLPASLK